MKVHFCGDCGRMILVGFEYCPYCGSRVRRDPQGSPAPAPGSLPDEARTACPGGRAGSLILMDRLIRDLEALDAEIEELVAVKGEQ